MTLSNHKFHSGFIKESVYFLTNLSILNLVKVTILNEGLKNLSLLTNINILGLHNPLVRRIEEWQHISLLTNLKTLNLSGYSNLEGISSIREYGKHIFNINLIERR
jgi:hypothetical protein